MRRKPEEGKVFTARLPVDIVGEIRRGQDPVMEIFETDSGEGGVLVEITYTEIVARGQGGGV